MDSAGKKVSQMDPAHGPPLQARVAAANGTVSQLANMMLVQQTSLNDDPGAHGMNRGKAKLNGGKNVEKGSGHDMAKLSRHTAC